MAIQVVGLNPAVDVEWRVDRVNHNEKTIIQGSRSWAGGKPPNVARWLSFLGDHPRLVMPLGGEPGRLIGDEMRATGVDLVEVEISEETRTNVMVTPDAGQQLRFNPKGPRLRSAEWREIYGAVESGFNQTGLTILSGSLPRAASVQVYARMIRLGRKAGVPVILDCDGPALAAGVKSRPFMVKPNRFELSLWAGRKLSTEKDFREVASELSRQTGGWVYVSLDAGGALLANAAEGFRAEAKAPRVEALNEVGAGDALLAQVALRVAAGDDPLEWLRMGVATGTAFVQVPAGKMPRRGLIRRMAQEVRVREF